MSEETTQVEPVVIDEYMTLEQVKERLAVEPAFGEQKCLIRNPAESCYPNNWWVSPRRGSTPNKDEAHTYTIASLLSSMVDSYDVSKARIYLINPPVKQPELVVMSLAALFDGVESGSIPKDAPCWIKQGSDYESPRWWAGGFSGYQSEADGSNQYRADKVADRFGIGYPDTKVIEIHVQLQPVDPSTPRRLCNIDNVLGATVVALIKAAPAHEQVRGYVLAKTGKWLPDGLETFDQIKDWIEFNYNPLTDKPTALKAVVPITAPRRNGDAIEIDVDLSYTEVGRCRYSVGVSGGGSVGISISDLEDIANAAEDENDFADRLSEYVNDNSGDVDCDNYDDYDHEDHEQTDSRDEQINFNSTRLLERALEWLEANQPEEYRRITGIEPGE